ncbi:F0F1 ATP synthase subunit delta [Paraferrimonas sedimenticola]|uniref:ATP synthase subunit delta n=1 Tax=Paraferrimonas sedimenticola TaxID=375674 RepID=A0AA37W091_9GAMM|nr:F0F1 ATP synthase subunit delta [Paraferrimonas sedimenticola]GLP97659.1 ATP synthase subunit delta [Paraferrimonas sedimenticola]
MAELNTIARPYAKAAFDFAVENKSVDEWQQMLAFAAMVSENETIADMLSGSIAAEKLADIFTQVCGEQVNAHGQNLIKVMAENGRLKALPAVAAQFAEFRNEWAKEVEAEVQSASELSPEQVQQISDSLEKRLARKVKLNCSVNAELVAGVVIKAGDLVIDGSVRGKLDRLADTLQS